MKLDKIQMRVQDEKARSCNFEEVALGYTLEEAKLEASRCLDCKNPRCVTACPVQVNIPGFIKHLLVDDINSAYYQIYEDNILPSICGRVCPQEKQCEGACIVGIKGEPVMIGALERFLGDYALENDVILKQDIEENGIKVAIVGSGPAGLACAAGVRKFGYTVDVFEALHDYGGVLKYGIPDFRLPKDIVTTEISRLEDIGVRFHKNVIIGKSITIDQLREDGYKAIFIGSGAGLPSSLRVAGENFSGVYFANEFLTRVNLMKSHHFPQSATPVKIGDNVILFSGAKIYSETVIGNNCVLHSGVVIGSDGFGFAPNKEGVYNKVPQTGNVIIEDNVWLGANATILGGVVIGKGSIIAANALVNKSVPPYSIVGGVPAKLIKKRN